jgi:RNA polymerase sigma-70 factor (ECF subfamily)
MDSQAATTRFERLFRAHYGRVLAYARRRTSEAVADDVVAETFLIAWRRLESVPGAELPWLLAVARRVLANERRRGATQERLAQRVAAEPAADGASEGIADGELSLALSQLGERDRELLMLLAWDGLSVAEAARVLGCSSVAARVRLHRARRRLEGLLRPPTTKETRWKTTGSTF